MRLRHHEDPKIERLHRIPLFEHSSDTALEHLAAAADEIAVGAGASIIEEGHRYREVYILTKGTADVRISDDVVADIEAGEVFGELGLFCHCSASASVTAKTDVELLSIPHGRFNQIMDENPELTRAMAERLAVRLLDMDRRYAELAAESER